MSRNLDTAPTVLLEKATLGYPKQPVLVEIDLRIEAGQLVGIVGCSGAGKSTLLSALAGGPVQLAGRVQVGGRDPRGSSHPVGLVPQLGDESVTGLSVTELVALGRPRRGLLTSRTERRHAADLLARLGLDGLQHRRLDELSGGQRQRVAIARALNASSTLLLCDEPTSGADPALTAEIVGVLREVAGTGTSVLVATHDLSVVAPRLDRIIGLADHVVRYDGTAQRFVPARQVEVYGRDLQTGEQS
jgi:ABC-type Mn2+/Zn2+ transport system ATPase subunit